MRKQSLQEVSPAKGQGQTAKAACLRSSLFLRNEHADKGLHSRFDVSSGHSAHFNTAFECNQCRNAHDIVVVCGRQIQVDVVFCKNNPASVVP